MRVLLTTLGSSGDINPFIAIGRELIRRGHEVVFLVNPYFEPAVTAAGLHFEALGEYFSPTDLARDVPATFARFRGPWILIRQYLVPAAMEMYRSTKSVARQFKPDLILCHQISFGVPWAARELGIPFATAALAPVSLLSVHSPSVYQTGWDVTNTPLWHRRFYAWHSRASVSFILDGALNKVRRELGMPPTTNTLFDEMLGGIAVLGMWSPVFRGPMPDDPPNLTICGFPWHDESTLHGAHGRTLEPSLESFLADGEPPVIFTLGSVLAHRAQREFKMAAKACETLGRRGVLVTGHPGSAPAKLPRGVISVDYAPYGQLLSRGALTVHHGGAGTTAQALRAGRPMIITPFAHDQFDNAARTQRIGVGTWLARRRFTGRGMARAIDSVLADGAMLAKARAAGERIRAENGASKAASTLETAAKADSLPCPGRRV